MKDDVLFLHPAIMAARDDLLVARQHRADRQSALCDADLGFANGFGHEFEMIGFYGHRSRFRSGACDKKGHTGSHCQLPCCDRSVGLPTSVGRAISASNLSTMRVSASSSV